MKGARRRTLDVHRSGELGHVARAVAVAQSRPVPLQRVGDLASPRWPPSRILLQAPEDDRLERLVDGGPARPRRLGELVDDAVHDRLGIAREGRFADDAFVEERAQGVDVGPSVDVAAGDLLRAEVAERAHQHARARHAALAGRPRQAEVHHAHADAESLLARHHDVLGLDVAVHHAARVAVVQGLGGLDADVDDVAELRVLPQERAQVRALHQRHDEVERVVVPAEVVDRDDGRVVHLRHQLRLALEALLGLGAQLGRRDQLDGDVAIEPRVAGAIDDPHAAATQF